jgi:hypothetical protein
MADEITVLDLTEITDVEDNDVIYVIRGTGAGRDKKQKRSNFLKDIKSDTIASLDTDGVNFTDVFGYNIDAPVSQLHLNESTSGACLLHITNVTTGALLTNGFSVGLDLSENAILHNKENTSMLFYTNNLERMEISNGGSVGIGVSASIYPLYVRSINANASIVSDSTNTGGNNFTGLRLHNEGVFEGGVFYNEANDAVEIWNSDTGGPKISVDQTNNVGIGTTSPQKKLHVQNGANAQTNWYSFTSLIIESNDIEYINIRTPNNKVGGIMFSDPDALYSGAIDYDHINNDMGFYVNSSGTHSLVIEPTRILINTTTESTTKDTGALVIEGGVGIEKNLSVGGNYTLPLKVTDTTESTSKDTGAIIVEGGIGVEKNLSIGGDLQDGSGNPVAGWLADGTPYYQKVVEMGDWNMDSTTQITYTHGLTWTDIIEVSAIIRDDPDTTRQNLEIIGSAGQLGGAIQITSTQIILLRATGGYFDNTSFDSIPYNRGWITIKYK